MADLSNAAVAIRTIDSGDAVIKICDATTVTQQLKVNSNGSIDTNVINDYIVMAGYDSANTQNVKVAVDSNGYLQVEVVGGVTAGHEYQDGDSNTSAYGTLIMGDDGTNLQTVQTDTDGVLKSTQKSGDIWEVHVNESGAGDEIHDFKQASSIAVNSADTHTYTVTTGKTLYLKQIVTSASDRTRIEIKTGASGSETTKMVAFGRVANPNVDISFSIPIVVAASENVLVVITNRGRSAQDVYSTIIGIEK